LERKANRNDGFSKNGASGPLTCTVFDKRHFFIEGYVNSAKLKCPVSRKNRGSDFSSILSLDIIKFQ
jgi:hypothetical protein